MIEFVNRNLEKTEPDYFYLVREHETTAESIEIETAVLKEKGLL